MLRKAAFIVCLLLVPLLTQFTPASAAGLPANPTTVSIVTNPSGPGYWIVHSDGSIIAAGVMTYGAPGPLPISNAITGMAATNDGKGYWLVSRKGEVFAYGDAHYYGSLANQVTGGGSIIGIAGDSADHGYYLLTSRDMVWAFGGVPRLTNPTYDGRGPRTPGYYPNFHPTAITYTLAGYALVDAKGDVVKVTVLGNNFYRGPKGITNRNSVTGMTIVDQFNFSYLLVGADGGVFAEHGASYFGNARGYFRTPAIAIAADVSFRPFGRSKLNGYFIAASGNEIAGFFHPPVSI